MGAGTDRGSGGAVNGQAEPVDGRRARRTRGRLSVTEAMIDLAVEGHLPPTAEQVAERAGVSQASLFRYFDNLDELRQATVRRYFERYAHLFEIPDIGIGPLDERIDRFVAARFALYETTEPMARLARDRAAVVTAFGAGLHTGRALLAGHVRQHFAAELATRTPVRREDLVAVVSTLTSFESWVQLRDEHGRSGKEARRAWVEALRVLL